MELTYVIEAKYDNKKVRTVMESELFMSSQYIKKLKLHGTVELNGQHIRVVDPVKTGDVLYLRDDDDAGTLLRPEGIKYYYEDEWIAVVSKPSGMVTHPTHGHLDDSLLTALSNDSLHPVMRLDRETSGLIIVAKNGYAHYSMLLKGNIEKKYLACVYGEYSPNEGTINYPIARREGSVMIRDCDPNGKEAITHYRSVYYDSIRNVSLVEFKLETGRCHQIRVHSKFMGHPLVGDGLYGPSSIDNPSDLFENSDILDPELGRVGLHAYSLKFYHPFRKEIMSFKADLPEDIASIYKSVSRETLDKLISKL